MEQDDLINSIEQNKQIPNQNTNLTQPLPDNSTINSIKDLNPNYNNLNTPIKKKRTLNEKLILYGYIGLGIAGFIYLILFLL